MKVDNLRQKHAHINTSPQLYTYIHAYIHTHIYTKILPETCTLRYISKKYTQVRTSKCIKIYVYTVAYLLGLSLVYIYLFGSSFVYIATTILVSIKVLLLSYENDTKFHFIGYYLVIKAPTNITRVFNMLYTN